MYYDKRIRYLNYYESGIKLQNAGYVKFQVRDHICQMIIYIKGPRLMGSGEATVYLLPEKRGRDDESVAPGGANGIGVSRVQAGLSGGPKEARHAPGRRLSGSMVIRNGQGHCAVRMDADNMGGTGLRYDEVFGIRIALHEYQYLESEWAVVNLMPWQKMRKETPDLCEAGNISGWGRGSGDGKEQEEEEAYQETVNLKVIPVSENVWVEKAETEWEETIKAEEELISRVAKEEKTETETRQRTVTEIEYAPEAGKKEAEKKEPKKEETIKAEEELISVSGAATEERAEKAAGETQREERERSVSEQKEGVVKAEEKPISGVATEEKTEKEGTAGETQGEEGERSVSEQREGTIKGKEAAGFSFRKDSDSAQKEQSAEREISAPEAEPPQEAGREAWQRPEPEAPEAKLLQKAGREAWQRPEPGAQETELPEGVQLMEQELKPDKWEQLRKTYPVVHPIREEEEYLKIAPKDFVIFTEKYQELVHNSFLLHGYYNYKHLILGKKEKNGENVYYLGVPGTFHDREKAVAVMFGFEAFDGKREPAENGDFGYYMRRVEL